MGCDNCGVCGGVPAGSGVHLARGPFGQDGVLVKQSVVREILLDAVERMRRKAAADRLDDAEFGADPHLAIMMDWVEAVRRVNADVFRAPTIEWSLLYTQEEISELARVVQRIERPNDLRGNGLGTEDLDDALHLEWGQGLMMHLTTGSILGVDPDRALDMALARVGDRSAAKREQQAASDGDES